MIVTFQGNCCIVDRESTDPKFYGIRKGAGESQFLYCLKKHLNNRGHDLIKKRMAKDGHLMDDMQQYLSTRNEKSKRPHIFIHNPHWAIEGIEKDFNAGRAVLTVTWNIFGSCAHSNI